MTGLQPHVAMDLQNWHGDVARQVVLLLPQILHMKLDIMRPWNG